MVSSVLPSRLALLSSNHGSGCCWSSDVDDDEAWGSDLQDDSKTSRGVPAGATCERASRARSRSSGRHLCPPIIAAWPSYEVLPVMPFPFLISPKPYKLPPTTGTREFLDNYSTITPEVKFINGRLQVYSSFFFVL
jgi:hypothetical protein